MFDIHLRPLKDRLLDPLLVHLVPESIHPLPITLLAFVAGLSSCYLAHCGDALFSAALFLLNRLLDCLDGAVARRRNLQSELGGFLDLLGDFIVYALVPIAIASRRGGDDDEWVAVAVLEASFYLNNFVLFYAAAVVEKLKNVFSRDEREVTSLSMRPAMIEGMESGVLFTLMLAFPTHLKVLAWGMAVSVGIGTLQRVAWLARLLAVAGEEGGGQ